MQLEQLNLWSFRNIARVALDPGPGFNVLVGPNAQGKTNVLEAIYLLGHLRSFRGARNSEMVAHGAAQGKLSGDLRAGGVRRRLELTVTPEGKSARLNGKAPGSLEEVLGILRPVLFSPEEIGLLKGSPAGRRSLLDRALFQSAPSFLRLAREYNRCLQQRNRLLRQGSAEAELLPWSEALIASGSRLRLARWRYVQDLAPLFRQVYAGICGGREEGDLLYPAGGENESELRQNLERELGRLRGRERQYGQTLSGPHRDDLEFLVDGRALRTFGSQGQQRSAVLAFKTAQIVDLEQRTGEPPLLLLDDMTSELDRDRQGYFFRFLRQRRGQIFITTTEIDHLRREGLGEGRVFRVTAGAMEEIHV